MLGMENSMTAVWVVLMIVFLVVEVIVPGLVSIWFALGALAALISSMLGAQLWLQAVWFIVVSVLALIATRPLAKKYVNSRVQATNADMLIGQECVVKEAVNQLAETGAVAIGGKIWTARTDSADTILEEGSIAVVERIEGVKLIDRKK